MRLVVPLVVLLAGCLGAPPSPPLPEGPFDLRLLATGTGMYHNGAGDVDAVPERPAAMPAYCVLYRQERAHEEDSCIVAKGAPRYRDDVNATWHVDANFKGSSYTIDDERRWSEKTIVAFAPDHLPVALWRGCCDYHPRAQRAIE